MSICKFCQGVQQGDLHKCPECGRGLVHYLPVVSEVYAAAAAFRDHWPECRIRKCEGYQELEIAVAHRCGDGMRRRETEDGRET